MVVGGIHATDGTLAFNPGETERTVALSIIDDTVEDGGETVGVGEHIMEWVPNPAFGSGRGDRDG